MRLRKTFLGIVVAVTVLVLCGGAAIYFLLRPRSYGWHEITSSDNQFRVSLPSNPSLLDTTEKATDGLPFVSHTLKSSPADRVFYVVNWWENPAQQHQSTEDLFAYFRECDIDAFHAHFLGEKALNVQGHPAKLIFLVTGSVFVEHLAIRAGNRVYSLTVLDPRTPPQEQENIRKFFGSFRLLQ